VEVDYNHPCDTASIESLISLKLVGPSVGKAEIRFVGSYIASDVESLWVHGAPAVTDVDDR
jgi:hypothetical protein